MKGIYFVILLINMLLFNSCTKASSNNIINNDYTKRGSNQGIVNSVSYKDGVYTGEGNLESHGKEIATITISDGKIITVIFQRLDASGKELIIKKSSDVKVDSSKSKLLEDNINLNVDYLILDVMAKQSYDISIPTKDKALLLNWKLAVKNALEKARK